MKDSFLKTEKIYTVLELNNNVRKILKEGFPDYIWVCGEIQDFRASRDKRHIYFGLVQKHPEIDQIIAKVNIAIFESRKQQIFKRLKEADASFELKDDIEVKLLCEVDLYPKTGNFSLIVIDIDPIYTLGKIAQSRQKIIEDLRKRGMLEKNKLQIIPALPLKIALITAYNSAAYHDFTNELKLSGYSFKVAVYNCHMQGKLVEKDTLKALRFFNNLAKDELDIIVITRGGGSTADLSAFDNKKIAEKIASSKFPVVSALGHQINITIADMVSHTSFKTPTKVAQFIVDSVRNFIEQLNTLEQEIFKKAEERISEEKRDLKESILKMDSFLPRYFRFHREELLEKKHLILNYIKVSMADKKQSLKQCFKNVDFYTNRILRHSSDNLKYLSEKIKILDPKNVLKRGYSITFKEKKAIKNLDDVEKDDLIKTVLYQGNIISNVLRKEKDNG